MYCSHCGSVMADTASFCSRCGQSAGGIRPSAQSVRIGYSDKINDPAFTRYKKNSNSWSAIFSLILAVIAIIAFPIYGKSSGEIDWPQSLYYGMGIGGMFIVIAILQIIKRGFDKTWDGVVIDKNSYSVRERDNDGHYHQHMIYILKIRKDSGSIKKHRTRDIPGPYGYYNIGDRIRHHKGFYYYEKYDKSNDSQIMCAACNSMNDIGLDQCQRCKCPLLK